MGKEESAELDPFLKSICGLNADKRLATSRQCGAHPKVKPVNEQWNHWLELASYRKGTAHGSDISRAITFQGAEKIETSLPSCKGRGMRL